MGSLEQIHSQMGGLRNLNIGIINNISTALAVDIGLGICGNQKLEDILKRASESNVCTYRIIHNVQKEDAVIFSGENGIDTTEKLKELILKDFRHFHSCKICGLRLLPADEKRQP